MVNFYNKIVWVTGGTRGIGLQIVKGFLDEGATVITNCSGNNKNNYVKCCKELKGKNVVILVADVKRESDVVKVCNYIKDNYGRLDILVNNAGITLDGCIENYDVETFKKVLEINLCGKFLCMQKAIELLKESDFPTVVNIASRLAAMPMQESVGYCCSQAAVVMMTKVAVLELQKYNIRVNTISPSLTETELSLSFYDNEDIEFTKNSNPMKRLCTPRDVYEAVRYVCSNEASYINGINLQVNGGSVMM